MLYGLSLNKSFGTLVRWDTDHMRVEDQTISWSGGMHTNFDSCISFTKDGLQVGRTAAEHFINTNNEQEFGNFIRGVSMDILDSSPVYIPVRDCRMDGREILHNFFQVLGSELARIHPPVPGDGEHMLVVGGPAVMNSRQQELFRQCAAQSGIPVQVQPSWFLQALACLHDDPRRILNGRFLLLDFGEEESCAAALQISEENGNLWITPRSLTTHPMERLSHRQVSSWILEELCTSDNVSYRSNMVPTGFWLAHDFLILSTEAERCRRQIMERGKTAVFSVGNLYQNQFMDMDGLTARWCANLLERRGFTGFVHSMIDQALQESGWAVDMLDGIYITRHSGAMFRNLALQQLGIPENDPRCPVWTKERNQVADGAAIYAKFTCVGRLMVCNPVTRIWLCCRTEQESPSRLWHNVALYSQGSMRINCAGSHFVEFFILDAAIENNKMSNNRGTESLTQIPVPAGSDVILTVYMDGDGGYICKFTSGRTQLQTFHCHVHPQNV